MAKRAKVPSPKRVALVGVQGCGTSTLVRALSGEPPGDAPPQTQETQITQVDLGGLPCALHDVPGDGRSSEEEDYDEAIFGQILSALHEAEIIVHVIDAADRDPERMGCRLDRWIYGSGHDQRAPVVVALTKRDIAAPETLAALQAVWPGAIAVCAPRGDGIEALREAIAGAVLPPEPPPSPLADWSLVDLWLSLVQRTRSASFDGPALASELRSMLSREEIGGVVFLREGLSILGRRGERREPGGLLFLSRIHEGVWDADTLHVLASSREIAEDLRAALVERFGAAEAELAADDVVRARWVHEELTARTPEGHPSVQDIQRELVYRTQFNAFRGERIAPSLDAHSALWRAFAFGRLRLRFSESASEMPTWLNPVRGLAEGYWNADYVWIVAPDDASAERLVDLAEMRWFADSSEIVDPKRALSIAGVALPARLVELWWD